MTDPLLLRRSARAAGIALLGAVLLLAALPGPVWADTVIESEPPADEIVGEAPEAILVTFDEPLALQPGATSVALLDAEGVRLDDGRAAISTYSRRTVVVHFAEGREPEGPVTVVWLATFASDGAVRDGQFTFTVEPGAVPVVEPAEAAAPRSSQGIALWTVVILGGMAVFALLLYSLRVATGNARSSVDPVGDGDHH